MKEAVSAIEAGGLKVFTFAPSAEASRGTLRQEGFSNAQTVAHLLTNEALHPQLTAHELLKLPAPTNVIVPSSRCCGKRSRFL